MIVIVVGILIVLVVIWLISSGSVNRWAVGLKRRAAERSVRDLDLSSQNPSWALCYKE